MDSTNRGFWRAMHSLAHPVSIAAVLLLLFNDHYLRHQHPSWLTGKLGDFAWLVFAPFIAAMFFALILPRRIQQQERITGMAAFISIGLWFALAKTVPAVHELTTSAWNMLIGWQGSLRMDVTDLLALPALLIGWFIWRNASNAAINLRPVAYVAFGLGLVGTLASDSPVDTGIGCLYYRDDDSTLFVAPFDGYKSMDGGLTWVKMDEYERVFPDPPIIADTNNPTPRTDYGSYCNYTPEITDPNNSQILYRFPAGENIETSNDGGINWRLEYRLDEYYQDARNFYHQHEAEYPAAVIPGAGHALFHRETGNLVVTMGHDGLLVRTPDGQWHRVAVDSYRLIDISQLNTGTLANILSPVYALAITLCFLVLTTTTAWIRRITRATMRVNWLGAGWIGWIFLIFEFNNAGSNGLRFDVALLALAMLVFIALPLSLGAIWDVGRNFRQTTPHILIVSLLANAAFLFPFLLWTTGTVPRYTTAALFSVLMTGTVLYAAYVFYKPRLPQPEKEKRKNEETLVEAKPEA
jgi:hypothetical protein